MAKKYHIYGMGNALVDFEIETNVAELEAMGVEKGVMTLIDQARQIELLAAFKGKHHSRACGGSAANSIIGAQTLGSPTFYSCKVASDETGHFYRQDLLSHGVASNLSTETLPEGDTGKCLVMVTDDADRTMNTFLGITGDIDYAQIDETALLDAEYLYIEGYLSSSPVALEAAVKAMAFARANQVKTAFSLSDPNMVKFCRDGLVQIISSGVDVLFCNEEEAMAYADVDSLTAAVNQLSAYAKVLVITLGAKGALIHQQGESINIAGNKVEAVDTNGAGDLFAGSFLHAVNHGLSLSVAGQIASYASSLLVTQFGPRLDAQRIEQVKTFAKSLGA